MQECVYFKGVAVITYKNLLEVMRSIWQEDWDSNPIKNKRLEVSFMD